MSARSLITVRHKGDFSKTESFFQKNHQKNLMDVLNRLGQRGVDVLSAATPVRTGKTAASWRYIIVRRGEKISLQWHNDNTTESGDNIVTLLVRGHGTRNGHYVRGNNFVTPAIKPIFEEIANQAWAEVTK